MTTLDEVRGRWERGEGWPPGVHYNATAEADVKFLLNLVDQWKELFDADRGFDVLEHLDKRIDKLYMALNARGRGDENDLDGEPAKPWDRLVGALSMSMALALANGRWAVLEHRRAEALIETSKVVAELMACDHMPRLGVEVDPECGRCEWMAPFRQALAEASGDAKAETHNEQDPGRDDA